MVHYFINYYKRGSSINQLIVYILESLNFEGCHLIFSLLNYKVINKLYLDNCSIKYDCKLRHFKEKSRKSKTSIDKLKICLTLDILNQVTSANVRKQLKCWISFPNSISKVNSLVKETPNFFLQIFLCLSNRSTLSKQIHSLLKLHSILCFEYSYFSPLQVFGRYFGNK